MKTIIHTLQDALAFSLQGLLYTEKKVKEEFRSCSHQISSEALKVEIRNYIDTERSKLLKLDRIFNYLMQEPMPRKNEIINRLIDETHQLLSYANTPHLKDILMISCIMNINAYKISSYRTAYLFSIELELDTASDLLQQILEWELETGKSLGNLAIEEFNKTQEVIK